jgi:hypothetical protein
MDSFFSENSSYRSQKRLQGDRVRFSSERHILKLIGDQGR